MMSPVYCLLYPASCPTPCVCMCECVHSARCLSLSLWVGHIKYARYCTLIYACAAMLSHLFTQAFGDNYARPPAAPLYLPPSLCRSSTHCSCPWATLQPCTSIDNNSQAQKTAYFQYYVVSITVILPYPPQILTPSHLPSKRT